jgi:hypothetical protein
MWRALRNIFSATALVLCGVSAHAVTLDWDQNSWAPSPSPAPNVTSSSFDIDPAKSGNDVTITATATSGAPWQPSLAASPAPAPMTPVVSQAFQGGDTTVHSSLELSVNFAKQVGQANDYITVTINFSAQYPNGVSNVSFTLFDIDYANDAANNSTFEDKISLISATTNSGGSMAPDITIASTGATVAKTGTGLNQVLTGISTNSDLGANSGNGNATITFTGDNIRSITFQYAPGSTFSSPTYQHIGIGDISFSPVPEINPAISAALSCVVAVLLIYRHRTNVRKRRF